MKYIMGKTLMFITCVSHYYESTCVGLSDLASFLLSSGTIAPPSCNPATSTIIAGDLYPLVLDDESY